MYYTCGGSHLLLLKYVRSGRKFKTEVYFGWLLARGLVAVQEYIPKVGSVPKF